MDKKEKEEFWNKIIDEMGKAMLDVERGLKEEFRLEELKEDFESETPSIDLDTVARNSEFCNYVYLLLKEVIQTNNIKSPNVEEYMSRIERQRKHIELDYYHVGLFDLPRSLEYHYLEKEAEPKLTLNKKQKMVLKALTINPILSFDEVRSLLGEIQKKKKILSFEIIIESPETYRFIKYLEDNKIVNIITNEHDYPLSIELTQRGMRYFSHNLESEFIAEEIKESKKKSEEKEGGKRRWNVD